MSVAMAGEKETSKSFCTVILAAGKGTRMKTDLPKVLHEINGKPLLRYVLDTAKAAGAEKIIVVIGHQAQKVQQSFAGSECIFVLQEPQLGTGHAVLQAERELANYPGIAVILCGDVPLLKPATIKRMLTEHLKTKAALSVLTAIVPDARGYGRIVKDKKGNVVKIVEELDATESEKQIDEINAGIYCAPVPFLFEILKKVENKNSKNEYYLTDIVQLVSRQGDIVHACLVEDYQEVMGVNTPDELRRAAQYLQAQGGLRLKGA